jgi:DNA polymerase-3 subunit epsilon
MAAGVPLLIAVSALTNLWACAAVRVAHNLEFDEKVIRRAISRLGRESTVAWPPAECTKELAAPIVNLPPTERMVRAGYGDKPKAPSLRECYQHFFKEEVPQAHSALADTRACARVYLKILEGR